MRWFVCVVVLAVLSVVPSGAQAAPRAVVELFTSPNCSSCPPAVELFAKLARNPDLITLVMPIDDWGRRDRLAKPSFTDRQSAYADVRNEESLFTPQAMINGAAPAVGSDPSEIDEAIAQTAGVLSVPVNVAAVGKEIVVSVGAARASGSTGAMITLIPIWASRNVSVRGETITYANLVRDIVPLGRWSGKPVRQTVPLDDYAQYDGIVVLLQAGTPERPGPILGATRISIRSKA